MNVELSQNGLWPACWKMSWEICKKGGNKFSIELQLLEEVGFVTVSTQLTGGPEPKPTDRCVTFRSYVWIKVTCDINASSISGNTVIGEIST